MFARALTALLGNIVIAYVTTWTESPFWLGLGAMVAFCYWVSILQDPWEEVPVEPGDQDRDQW